MKKLAAFLLISFLLLPHFAHADCDPSKQKCITFIVPTETPPTCDQVLSACDKALNDQIRAVQLQKDLIKSMELKTNVLEEQNHRLQSDAQMWYRNPLIVGPISFTVGALVAIYITSRIQH